MRADHIDILNRSVHANTSRNKPTCIRFHRCNMPESVFHFFGCDFCIALATSIAIFFIDEQNKSQGSDGLIADFLQSTQCFKGMDYACTIIVGTLANVPRVEMAAKGNDFVGTVGAAPFANDIALCD